VYEDTYYDWPDHRLTDAGRRELRVRVIRIGVQARTRLTFKGIMLDTTSTPEYETTVEDLRGQHHVVIVAGPV
jgi:adenylate cyclase class IV